MTDVIVGNPLDIAYPGSMGWVRCKAWTWVFSRHTAMVRGIKVEPDESR